MDIEHDLGDAAEYIAAERPGVPLDHIWTVLNELGTPPTQAQQPLAEELFATLHPGISVRDVRAVLGEWRAFLELEASPDWEDLEDD